MIKYPKYYSLRIQEAVNNILSAFLLILLFGLSHQLSAQPVPVDPLPTDTIPSRSTPVTPDSVDSLLNRNTITDSTSVSQIPTDSLRARNQSKEFKPDFLIFPLMEPKVLNSVVIQTDSTLRWNQWLEYSELLSRANEVISHRLGGFNRNDYHLIGGRTPMNQTIFVEGMLSNDPVTGNNKMAFIPLERISEINQTGLGQQLRTNVILQQYYTRKPLTRVSYEQTAFELRNTDGHVSQMINQRTGLDLVFQGKNNAGEYARTQTLSRQLSARVFHHLNERYVAQALFMYNGAEHQESDGYAINDLATFNFSRFFATALRSDANSRVRNTQFQVSIMRRGKTQAPNDSLKITPSLNASSKLMLYYDRYRRSYAASADSSQFRWQSLHLSGIHQINSNWMSAQADLNGRYYMVDKAYSQNLDYGNWAVLDGGIMAEFTPVYGINIPLEFRSTNRSDGFSGFETSAGLELYPFKRLKVFGVLSKGATLPTMQELYWSGSFKGNSELKSAPYFRASVGIEVGNHNTGFLAGIKGYHTKFDRFSVIRFDSTFYQHRDIGQFGGDVLVQYHSRNWELSASSAAHVYTNELLHSGGNAVFDETIKVWNRASIHWKGYGLKRAAYIKTGFYGIFSPMAYHTPVYIPVADVWNLGDYSSQIPGFFRLDYDLSARVRNLMVLVRWENVAEGLGQLGYYETAPYPMPSRRLRFGLRVIFSN